MTRSRREFATVAGGALASLALGGVACHASGNQTSRGRLTARPSKPAGPPPPPGVTPIGIGKDRDGLLWLPENSKGPVPLMVLLHGAGGRGANILRRLESFAADTGVAVLAPDSRGMTWDAIRDELGLDVRFIDRALDKVFQTVAIDPARTSIGGFSDGATYALTLGLINGDLFRRIIAFSPGFYVGGQVYGRPEIFVSHGTADPVLPIDRCSRIIVPALKKQGYSVTFRQFDGGHEIPPHVAKEGLKAAARR
jgi:phospholipase/carboxylesterase